MPFVRKARHLATVAVMEQELAEAIVDKGLHHSWRCGGWERARHREPGWTHPVEGPNLKRGSLTLCTPHRVEPERVSELAGAP